MALTQNDLHSNAWWASDKANEMNQAQNEYVNTQNDLANAYKEQAGQENYVNDIQQADTEANDIAKAQDELNTANQQTYNTIADNSSSQAMAQNTQSNLSNVKNTERQNKYKLNQQKRDYKNQETMGYLQLASDEAKMKYQLATDRYNQAQANISNTIQTLATLGLSVAGFFI